MISPLTQRLTVRLEPADRLFTSLAGSLLKFVHDHVSQDRGYKGQRSDMMRRRTLVEMVVYRVRILKLCRMNANGSTYW
jgi:hypothetical protein